MNFPDIELKRQKLWQNKKPYKFNPDSGKPKYYVLVMFPYPSGRIHMGHVRNYVIGDVFARYYRLKGYEVFHPIGWDSFGLPAENAAIKNKIHPHKWTEENISHMKSQLMRLGISYDWDTEIATSRREYYRWNQWFFIKMFEKGLAYRKKSSVNWCPSCATVLANEQIVGNGECWRCHSQVETKELEQWFIRITDYAQRLLDGHKLLENKWPDEVLAMQKYWLGRSEGAEVDFQIDNSDEKLKIFTTRPDTLFGATFMVVSPEHPFALKVARDSDNKEIPGYIENYRRKKSLSAASLSARLSSEDTIFEKTGVPTGRYAINPVNGKKIPIWISDYVTMDYGTGAIMCVPAHDQRDFDFAKKFNLEIIPVIKPKDSELPTELESAYEGEGMMINSGEYSGLDNRVGAQKIVRDLSRKGIAVARVNWRLKDWLISRQRYWGTPIPVVYCDKCGIKTVPEKDLPVVLPEEVELTGTGQSPLASNKNFVNTKCPQCGGPARRETDTMDTFVDSSWYYARYCDPKNDQEPFDIEKTNRVLPVEQYIGGIEHACMHLIYSRFWHKFMKDIGFVSSEEPFENLLTQGMVTLNGETMSKSKGNIVEPDVIISKYGADVLRLFIIFAAPPEKPLDWSDSGVEGIKRFLTRIERAAEEIFNNKNLPSENDRYNDESLRLKKISARCAEKISKDIQVEKQLNTAISTAMELLNSINDYQYKGDRVSQEALKILITVLLPFAPHFAEEMLEKYYGVKDAFVPDKIKWPEIDQALLTDEKLTIPVQINGKLRGYVEVGISDTDEMVLNKIKSDTNLSKYILPSAQPKKFIYVKTKIANIVI